MPENWKEHWTPYRPELAKEYEEKGYWKSENFSQVFDNIAERFWEREVVVFRLLYQYSEDLTYRTSLFPHKRLCLLADIK